MLIRNIMFTDNSINMENSAERASGSDVCSNRTVKSSSGGQEHVDFVPSTLSSDSKDSGSNAITDELLRMAADWNCSPTDRQFAVLLDQNDKLRHFRQQFCYPKMRDLPGIDESLKDSDEESVYLCGHSLGLMPKSTTAYVQRQLDKWAAMGVHGHRHGELPWAFCDEYLTEQSAELIGALNEEVAIMNGLTVNEHLLMISFYQPTASRHKILIEKHAFPSDHYCAESQIRLRGYDPNTSLLFLQPRQGEELLRTEDILETIEKHGDSIAVILLPGVQYYTGQVLDMATITQAGHKKGCFVGFDLAHAIGNIDIRLHDWDVDFACWCTYKYLNSGAGNFGGFFIHSRHANNDFPKLLGWWSHRIETRFSMTNVLELSPGAAGYRISNPSALMAASLKASLDVFSQTSMADLRTKSKLLTGYAEYLLKSSYGRQNKHDDPPEKPNDNNNTDAVEKPYIDIITPSDPEQRGCQLSVKFSIPIDWVFAELSRQGAVLDKRLPHVLRIAPCPLYNSFDDVYRFVEILRQTLSNMPPTLPTCPTTVH